MDDTHGNAGENARITGNPAKEARLRICAYSGISTPPDRADVTDVRSL